MTEHLRVATKRHQAAVGQLILAFVVFQTCLAKGQCNEPANPKAEIPSANLAPKLGAGAAVLQAHAPAQVIMMYKPPMTSVPDLSNKTLDEVKSEVLNKLTIQTVNNNNPGWVVERQFPVKYSNVAVCSQLELWMKMLPQQLTIVPPIVGVPEGQIASLLGKYHLKYGGSTPKETTAASGTIFDQDPKPGTLEPWGSDVIAYKATGPQPMGPLPLALTADRTSVTPGETVRFVARLQSDSADAQYVFNFGDGSPMVTRVPAISHRFYQDGDYEVSVTMTLGDRQGQSEPLHITVHSTEYNLAVSWEPLHPLAGQLVRFTARISPDDPLIAKSSYYFYFGEKTKPKPSRDVYSRPFAKPGTYPVNVRVTGGHGHTIESIPLELVVMEIPDWWKRWGKYVVPPGVVALMCAFAGLYLASKYLTGLVGLRAAGRAGVVSLHHDGRNGLEAAFGFRLEQPVASAIAEFRGAVIRKVERIV
jgi:hypothetical protein